MSDRERIKRPELGRTRPVRSWSGVLGAGARGVEQPDDHSRGRDDRPDAGEYPENGQGASDARSGSRPDGSDTPAASVGDAVSRSVELGYQVIDDYVRQGQDTARRVREGRYGPDAWAQDVQDLGVRMAQHASDLVGAWMQLLEIAIGGNYGPTPPESSTANGSQADGSSVEEDGNGAGDSRGARGVKAAATPLRVRVAGSSPVEVAVDLRRPLVAGTYVVHGLRSADPARPRLQDVRLELDEATGQCVLQVRVPDGHPPGVYEGLIVDDADNRPVGTVSVVVDA